MLKEGCPSAIKNCSSDFSRLIDPQVRNTLLTDIAHFLSLEEVGIVTGCCTRLGTAAVYSRVRVRVGFIQPWPYPYPQPGVGRLVAGRHIQTPCKKPVNGQPKRRQTHRMGGMFSSFLFAFFFKLTH